MHHFKTSKCMTFQCTICRFVTCNLHQLYFFKLPMALDPALAMTMTMTLTMTNVLLNINAYSDSAKYSL